MKLNINRHSLSFIFRYRNASILQGRHQTFDFFRFMGNICIRPQHSFYSPEFLKVEITTRCNLACAFCGAANSFRKNNENRGRHLEIETLKEIIKHTPKLRWIDLQGVGEPLVHPHFLEILEILANKGVSVQFTTNGTLLNKPNIEAIINGTVHSVTISLSAASPEKYHQLHGADRYEQVLNNISNLVAKRKYNSPRLRLLAVAMSSNLNELIPLVNIAKRSGVDELVYSAYKPIFEKDSNIPDISILRDTLYEIRQHAKNIDMPISIEIPIVNQKIVDNSKGVSAAKCLWPWTSFAVNVKGDIKPCCYSMRNQKYNFGNIISTPVDEIFNNQTYLQLRKALNKGATQHFICHFCNDHVG